MINKNKYKTLAIALEHEIYNELKEYCKDKTFRSIYVRGLIKKALNKVSKDKNSFNGNDKTIKIKVDNYKELEEYIKIKKIGSIKSFATFAMAQYMSRFPIKNNSTDASTEIKKEN